MRRANISLLYEGEDISQDIGPDLISFTFTDKSGSKDEADDVQIAISDRDKKWQGPWFPARGHTLRPTIYCENWFADGDRLSLNCGSFQVDEVEFEAGEADKVTIKGIPSAVKSALAGQKKTRAWQGASLERMAQDIAAAAGLGLAYRGDPVSLARMDQRQEPDLAFLARVAKEQGCRVKVADDKIIVFAGVQADMLAPITLTRGDGQSFRGKMSTADVYKGSSVSFTDPASGQTHKAAFTPPDAPETDKYLELNTRVENLAQAHHVAKSALRDKNKKQLTGEWSGMGDPRLRAGGTVRLSGFGVFDAVFTIKEATHTISAENYTTSLSLESALEY